MATCFRCRRKRPLDTKGGKTVWDCKRVYRAPQLPADIVAGLRIGKRLLCGQCLGELFDQEQAR